MSMRKLTEEELRQLNTIASMAPCKIVAALYHEQQISPDIPYEDIAIFYRQQRLKGNFPSSVDLMDLEYFTPKEVMEIFGICRSVYGDWKRDLKPKLKIYKFKLKPKRGCGWNSYYITFDGLCKFVKAHPFVADRLNREWRDRLMDDPDESIFTCEDITNGLFVRRSAVDKWRKMGLLQPVVNKKPYRYSASNLRDFLRVVSERSAIAKSRMPDYTDGILRMIGDKK